MQAKYKIDVLSFVETIENLCNPFGNERQLVGLLTKEIMEQEIPTSRTQLHKVGKKLHAKYVEQIYHIQIRLSSQCAQA